MSQEKRRNKRETCYAKAILADQPIPGYIRDISKRGLRVEFPAVIDTPEKEQNKLVVAPDETTGIENFALTISIKRREIVEGFTVLGIAVESADKEALGAFRDLIALYQ
ncbi:MAG: PilZ domain-containing protein [Spirochaetales bacterium]|nr:PilZ domain-containing protein [Spirochaetales bacterium]MCF7937926.1 PilZ domain-containing protein [Spirochaetales bacterium]